MKKKENIIFGLHSISEAINVNKTIDKILIKKGLKGELFQEVFQKVRKNGIPYQYVPNEKLNRITRANHQGVIAMISAIDYQDISTLLPGIYEKGKEPFILVLDGITDVRNFGAIARTADAAGIDAIIIGTKKTANINADAIKTSAGALNSIPVCRVDNLNTTIEFLKNSGLTIYGATEKASDEYYSATFSGPLAILMGSEDKGLSNNSLKLSDHLIKIPMFGKISSLNVSVATGILLFEVVRQKNTPK